MKNGNPNICATEALTNAKDIKINPITEKVTAFLKGIA